MSLYSAEISHGSSSNAVPVAVKTLLEETKHLIRASRAASTLKVYDRQWRLFVSWCDSFRASSLPASPVAVAMYIAFLVREGKAASTVNLAVAAIRYRHVQGGFNDVTRDSAVAAALAGARRTLGIAPKHKKAAVSPEVLRSLIRATDSGTLIGLRDRAMMLVGFSGAFRRSELVALLVSDLEWTHDTSGHEACLIRVRRSKTDQMGAGLVKAVFSAREYSELCPVRALRAYMEAAEVSDGFLFRRIRRGGQVTEDGLHPQNVALAVQNAAFRAGISLDLAAHSLRSGFITTALDGGASERSVMNQTGHRSVTIMRSYQQRASALQDNAAANVL